MRAKTKVVRDKEPGQADALSQRVVFCTTCGQTIENFCFSSRAEDLQAIRKTLAQCKSEGRFTGEFCSKLFIAHPEALDETGWGD